MEKQIISVSVTRLRPGYDDIPLPEYATSQAAGADLRAAIDEAIVLHPGDVVAVPTNLAIELPPRLEAQVRPRSGLALKHGIGMVNSPGTIDSDYRGEIGLIVVNWGREPFVIERGDRIAQMVIAAVSKVEVVEVEDLESTPRGHGGFGHSGI